jgi:hypothetical protein
METNKTKPWTATVVIKKIRHNLKENVDWPTVFLMTAMFLNPMGFDVVQLTLIELTGSLLHANLVMYFLAALFFGLYFYSSGKNPIKTIYGGLIDLHIYYFKKEKKTK